MTSFPLATGKLQALATELGRIEPNGGGGVQLIGLLRVKISGSLGVDVGELGTE